MSDRGTIALEMRTGAAGSAAGEARDITAFARRFTWRESLLRGGWTWELAFATEQWPEWQDTLIGREDQQLQFRLSLTDGDTSETTDWRTAVVDGSRMVILGETLEARVAGADERLLMMQAARTRAWPASTIADIVRRTAAEYDLEPVVEDTPGRRDRWQLREDDWGHLTRLAREAATASGRGDVFLWVEGGKLRLGAPEIGASVRRHDLSETEQRVNLLSAGYMGRAVDRQGGATLRAVGYNLDIQAPVAFVVDAAAAATQPALGRRVPRDPSGGLRVIPVTEESALHVEECGRAAWGRAGPRYFSLKLDTRPDLTLRPGHVVEAQAALDERRTSPFFGRFAVLEVEHVLTGGSVTTTAACYRREAFLGDQDPTGASASSGATTDRYRAGQQQNPRVVRTAEVIG